MAPLYFALCFYGGLVWYGIGVFFSFERQKEIEQDVTLGQFLFHITLGGLLGVVFATIYYWNAPIIKWEKK